MSSQEQPRPSAPLVIAALGVVFGDIGTSPLYALKESLNPEHGVGPEPAAVLGVLSLIRHFRIPPERVVELGNQIDL